MRSKLLTPLSLSILLGVLLAGCVQPASQSTAPQAVGANATWTQTFTPIPSPTATQPPTATDEPTPTEANSAFIPQSAGTEVAQEGTLPLQVSTATPFINAVQQFTVPEMTATKQIADATATGVFQLTATAAFYLPSPTATFAQDLFATPTAFPTALLATQNFQPPQTNAPLVPGQDCVHEVREQDGNLYRLSLAYGVTINQIAAASGIVNADLISIGQRLTIPGCGITGGRPPATSTPSPVGVAVGTGGAGFVSSNPTGDCSWGTSVVFVSGCATTTGGTTANALGTGGAGTSFSGRSHIVAQGETLFEISLLYGVTVASIANANGIADYDQIDIGQQLAIP
ncbi:MAG: LysM peptidoglycan-binding domain-containing protein [Phototrophicaceae bacterium]